MPIEIISGAIVDKTVPRTLVTPGQTQFLAHFMRDGGHVMGIFCDLDDSGGVVRDFRVPLMHRILGNEVLQMAFDATPNLDIITPNQPVDVDLFLAGLKKNVTFVFSHCDSSVDRSN